jgi:hypothetical protein
LKTRLSFASLCFSALDVVMLPVVGWLSYMKDSRPVRMVPTCSSRQTR